MIINLKKFKKTKTVLPLLLGKDSSDKNVIKDLTAFPNLLIMGRTGTGKTKFIQNLIRSITNNLSSTKCKFIIFDPKSIEYKRYNNFEHLLCPVVTEAEESFKQFEAILQIISNRYKILSDNKVENIAKYHKKISDTDMPYIVVIIDELADFISLNKEETEQFIHTLHSVGHTVGIHAIIASQTTDLSQDIKDSFPAKAVFQVRTSNDSISILGESGAENLSNHGDMLFCETEKKPVKIHITNTKN